MELYIYLNFIKKKIVLKILDQSYLKYQRIYQITLEKLILVPIGGLFKLMLKLILRLFVHLMKIMSCMLYLIMETILKFGVRIIKKLIKVDYILIILNLLKTQLFIIHTINLLTCQPVIMYIL